MLSDEETKVPEFKRILIFRTNQNFHPSGFCREQITKTRSDVEVEHLGASPIQILSKIWQIGDHDKIYLFIIGSFCSKTAFL